MGRRAPIEKRVAERVRSVREKLALTQADLARLARTSRSQVAAVERGDRAPTITTLDAFARALGVPLAQIVQDDAPPEAEGPDRVQRLALMLRDKSPAFVVAVERVVAAMDRLVEAKRPRDREQ